MKHKETKTGNNHRKTQYEPCLGAEENAISPGLRKLQMFLFLFSSSLDLPHQKINANRDNSVAAKISTSHQFPSNQLETSVGFLLVLDPPALKFPRASYGQGFGNGGPKSGRSCGGRDVDASMIHRVVFLLCFISHRIHVWYIYHYLPTFTIKINQM